MWEMPPFHNQPAGAPAASGSGHPPAAVHHSHQHPPPPHGGQNFERSSDPLGINQNGPPANGPHPHHQHHPPQHHPGQQPQQHPHHHHPGFKRRPSEEMGGQQPAPKRYVTVTGPWDLELPTNVIIYERKPTMLPHPHPDVEMLRVSYVTKLRQSFQEMCHSRESEADVDRGTKLHICLLYSTVLFFLQALMLPRRVSTGGCWSER